MESQEEPSFDFEGPETKLWEVYDYIRARLRYEEDQKTICILWQLSMVVLEKASPF